MQQTPLHHGYNADVLSLMPRRAARIVEVGCSSGALARAYRQHDPDAEYVGIEVEAEYADVARSSCSRVVVGNIETLDEEVFSTLLPCTCWVFGDVLEHLYDPWAVLRRLRAGATADTSVVACIPNAQHWSMQARLNGGALRYQDSGLMDRTHIRWFTRATIRELFESSGFRIADERPRVFDEPGRARFLEGVKAFAAAVGGNPEAAVADAVPLQWVVRARPAALGGR